MRARESARPDRLFHDSFAQVLAGPQGDDVLNWMEVRSPGAAENPAILIRTRFFGDTIEHIVAQSGVEQIVLVAAGMDTRAFRLPLPLDATVFELDRTEVLDLKAARLSELAAVSRCQRLPIPVDLSDDWSPVLCWAGFDRDRPSIWLVEGLLMYQTEAQVHHVLGTLSALAAPDSWLRAGVFGHSFLTLSRLPGFRAMMAVNGSPLQKVNLTVLKIDVMSGAGD